MSYAIKIKLLIALFVVIVMAFLSRRYRIFNTERRIDSIKMKTSLVELNPKESRTHPDICNHSCRIQKYGGNPLNNDYGSWMMCQLRENLTNVLISVGSGCDSTFEISFLTAYSNSFAHIFDPTVSSSQFEKCFEQSAKNLQASQQVRKRVQFWRLGLSDSVRVDTFYKSKDPKIASLTSENVQNYNSIPNMEGQVIDLLSMLRLIPAHSSQMILKMDVEGSEFKILSSWCEQSFSKENLPQQLLVEYHDRFFPGRGSSQRLESLHCLSSLGYRKEWESNSKEEMVFRKCI